MEHLVHVWDASNPSDLKLTLVLNHRVPDAVQPVCESLVSPEKSQAPQNLSQMKWLTKSEIEGVKEPQTNFIVSEAIADADVDVPEVTQVIKMGAVLGMSEKMQTALLSIVAR